MMFADSAMDYLHVKLRAAKIMLPKLFHAHGLFCASHPWEVIVFTLTLTLSVLSMGSTINSKRFCVWNKNCAVNDFNKNADVVIMTLTRCMAVLYSYHQFRNLRTLGSKYILGIAGLFTVFSSFVFSSSVINFLQGDFSELNEALPFFFLLIDLSKASLLAQFALTSSSQQEVRHNIARGMALLGPTITLDTIVETLVIGVGTLSGMKRLEAMCCFACLSVVVNYLVFMTFFPACLSLVLELSRDRDDSHPVWQLTTFTRALQEEEQKPNPVLQRVKLIMSAGLLLVHAHSRWPITGVFSTMDNETENVNVSYIDEDSTLGRWLTVSPDQIVMVILALALAIKYVFFEPRDSVGDIISPHRDTSSFLFQDSSSTSSSHTVASVSTTPQKVKQRTKITQTESDGLSNEKRDTDTDTAPSEPRSIDECIKYLKNKEAWRLTDDEIISLVNARKIAAHKLEEVLQDAQRAVPIRRKIVAAYLKNEVVMDEVPFEDYDYSYVDGACCENVIGYTPVPLGVVGPLLVNGVTYHVPMATTEGCLLASTNRGCAALTRSGGVTGTLVSDGMTRGPFVRLPSARRAGELMRWFGNKDNFEIVRQSFNSTTRFGRLQTIQCRIAGPLLYIRFKAFTGDAMGMNMVSKGAEKALNTVKLYWPEMEIVSLSGNYCTDKKSTALNWIDGRGKGIVCEATVKKSIVENVLKTTVPALVEANIGKNLIGSALAGSVGGFNSQAANVVTAMFIAMGQDPAQNITSSNCLTMMERGGENGEDLYMTVTMPSIEVGTIGGGTFLPAQAACLQMLGVRGSCEEEPGANASTFALIVGAAVLAGDLSLLSALTAGHLVDSHMKHNRTQKPNEDQSVSTKN